MKKAIFYQLSQQAYDLIKNALASDVVVINENYLNASIESLLEVEGMMFSEGTTFAIYYGFEQNEIVEFVNKTQAIHPMIHASFTEYNRQWLLRDLIKELTQEHKLFACYEQIAQALQSLNSKMTQMRSEDKKVVMEAYMVYQKRSGDLELLEKLEVKLREILKEMKNEI